jgi:truncated hemoglobin YjbI
VSRFRIDDVNLYELLGAELIWRLSTAFYRRVDADPDEWFRSIFPADLTEAVQNQAEFFIQRLGGPPLYSQRKGHPALRARHARFAIPKQAAGRWLKHMIEAMDEVGVPDDARDRLEEFFTDTAYFLQNLGDGGERLY